MNDVKLYLSIILPVVAGVLWLGRLESRVKRNNERIKELKDESKNHFDSFEKVTGELTDIKLILARIEEHLRLKG